MGAEKVFSVVTEFKFDIQTAVANSDIMQEALKSLAGAAEKVEGAFQSMGKSMLSGLGISLGAAGSLGTLHKALSLSDQFQDSVLDFTAQIGNNMNYLQGSVDNFSDRLAVSRTIMKDIAEQADNMNLDGGDLLSMVKGINPAMLSHYAAGKNMSGSIGIASSALSVASGMGLSGASMKDQLASLLSGSSTGGALFQRLGTTKGMKGMKIEDFVGEDFKTRLKLIQGAFSELSKDMGDVAERGNMLSTQLSKLKEAFFGENGILRPIGDAIKPIFVDILKQVNSYVKNEGTVVAKNMTTLLKSFLGTPTEMYVAIERWRHLRRDVSDSAKVIGTASMTTGLGMIATKLTGLRFLSNPLLAFAVGLMEVVVIAFKRAPNPFLSLIVSAVKWASIGATLASVLAYFGILWSTLSFVISGILLPLAGLTMIFQAMTKAAARTHISDALVLADLMPRISEWIVDLKMALNNIMSPFDAAVDGLANLMEPFFDLGIWMDMFAPLVQLAVDILVELGRELVNVTSAIAGVGNMFARLWSNWDTPTQSLTGDQGLGGPWKKMVPYEAPTGLFTGVGDAFNDGFTDAMRKYGQRREKGEDVSKSVTNNNIAKVEITNDLKEGMEPDRIAFTIKEQLLNAHTNKSQSRSRSLGFMGAK